jgi:hypothetical protein
MPALPDVAKVIKVALVFSDGLNDDIVTRFYLQYSGTAPGATELNTFCSDVDGQFAAHLADQMTEELTLIRIEAIDLTTTSSAEGSWVGAEAGTGTDPPVPVDVCVVSSYKIARRYRGGHPRGYWPFGTSGQLETLQTWTEAFISNLHDVMNTFFTNVRAATWTGAGTLEHVNVSYFEGFTVVTDPTTGRARNVPTVRATPVVDIVTSRIERIRIGTQRRRLQY